MEKVAIVTGGAKGIGRAIVQMLASLGINIVLNYRYSEKEAKAVQEELIAKGNKVEIYKADVTKREEVKELIAFAKYKFGEIDILVNNAGISQMKLFTDITDEDWSTMIQTNLTSAFITTQEVLKDMIQKKRGCIINISSVDAITGASCEVPYSVAKAGMDGMTKALAKEVAPSNIRVNSIAPGAIMTDMCRTLSQETIQTVESEIPLGRLGKPEDIAKCVQWLVQDEYTTGQVISPNGGWVI